MNYLPNLVNSNIFTSTGSEGNFNGTLAIRRSEIAVLTSKSLEYFNKSLDKIRKPKDVNTEDLLVKPEDNKASENNSSDKDSNIDKNTILDNQDLNPKPHDGNGELEAAEANIPINFKGQVIEIIESKNVNFIRIKVTVSDSDRFGPGQVITVNTFRKHNINDIVEGYGILGENSLTNIKLK